MVFSFTKVSAIIPQDFIFEPPLADNILVQDTEDVYENYTTLFEYAQPLDFQSQNLVEVSGEILSYSYEHDFDVYSICLEDYMTISFDFDFPSPYLFVEFYSDHEIDQYYPYDYSFEDAADIINRYKNEGYYSETQLESGITLPAGRYFVLVSTSSISSFYGNGIDYSFTVEQNQVVFDDSVSIDFLRNAGFDGAVWTTTFQQEYHYLYDDENPESTYYPVQYSKDTNAYEFYTDFLNTTSSTSEIPDGDYLYKRIFMFSKEFQVSLLTLLSLVSREYQLINQTYNNIREITSIVFEVAPKPTLNILGGDILLSISLEAIVNEIIDGNEKYQFNLLIDYLEQHYSLFQNMNLVELMLPVFMAENYDYNIMKNLKSIIFNDIINDDLNKFRFFDIIASKRITESEALESIQTTKYYIRLSADGDPLVLDTDYRDDIFSSGKEVITSGLSYYILDLIPEPYTSLSKTTGLMEYIGGDGGALNNLGEESGVFVDNSLEPVIEGDNLYVFDEYYQTQRHYSYKTYEYFDRVAFKVYKKGLFDSYKSTLNYYIDESPSTSTSATSYTYERYYIDQQIYNSVYASTYFYAYVDGANRMIYLKDRSNVAYGDYYVKEVNVSLDYFKLYRSTTVSGWYNTTKYDFGSGDYYYDYYYSSVVWTDYFGNSRSGYLRYQKSFTIFG
jgi:hypothetical protein